MPTISVIVPVYNIEEEISKCLLSILLQKFSDFEIIVVDDGSTDESSRILDEFNKKYSQVKVYRRKNHGLSAARNYGIKRASGRYIAFVDGDDFVDPDFLSKLYQSIADSDSDISVCGYTEFLDEDTHDFCPKREIITGKQATVRLLRRQENIDIISWNKLYKKSLFKKIGFPTAKNHEDNFTTFKLFYEAKKVSFIPLPLYNYVRRDGSITKKEKTITRLSAKLEAAHEAKKYFKKDLIISPAAQFSEILAYFQFIDFSIKKEIPKSNFSKYREKVLNSNVKLDRKRRFYKRLLTPFNGFFYKIFRKLTK